MKLLTLSYLLGKLSRWVASMPFTILGSLFGASEIIYTETNT